MFGISWSYCEPNQVPAETTVITDCFVMETPCGDPGHDRAVALIDHCSGKNNRMIFYYPSESYATLSASFCPTADYINKKNVAGYLIKCGDWDIDGYVKNYNMPEFFAWIIASDFNLSRSAWTQQQIDIQSKQKQFLFLNGERRTNREHFFELFKQAGLLEYSIWSYRSGKSASGFGPDEDWQDAFVHPDFRFYAHYPSHFYKTAVSIVSETTQNEWFPTEKTYKSLMLGHPFVIFGGQHSLAKLKNLGFQTFDPVIDESYDLCEYPMERAQAMIDCLLKCRDIPDITEQTQTTRHHNRAHFLTVANSAYKHLLDILQDIDNCVTIVENFEVNDTVLQKYFLN
jgi:hypothetical protein